MQQEEPGIQVDLVRAAVLVNGRLEARREAERLKALAQSFPLAEESSQMTLVPMRLTFIHKTTALRPLIKK